MNNHLNIVCLVGGVGGAKLAFGLAQILPAEALTLIGNTGDDFVHLGLTVCPDLDTVMYTLADLASRERGWGLEGETWRGIERVKALGGPAWFNLGDLDLATHLTRTHLLREGATLTEATAHLFKHVGLETRMLPMCDTLVPTMVETADGTLGFQEWFVREQWQPVVKEILLPDEARATPQVVQALKEADIVIIAPSNPFVSVAPILNCYPVRPILEDTKNVVIALSPFVGDDAVKGPSAKMMRDWDMDVTAQRVAEFYGDMLSGFVYDERDAVPPQLDSIELLATDSLMLTDEDRVRVAEVVLQFGTRQLENINYP